MINYALYDYYAESLTQDDCTHGDVRLVGTPLRSQGVVEICLYSHWDRVCRDGWGNNDAKVVCNQLDFGRDGNSYCYYYKLTTHASKS